MKDSINMWLVKNKAIIHTLYIILVFQSLVERFVPFLKYYDEMLAIIGGAYVLYEVANGGLKRADAFFKTFFAFSMIYFSAGTISTVLNRYQRWELSIGGAFLAVKWMFLFAGVYLYNSRVDTSVNLDLHDLTCFSIIWLAIWVVLSKTELISNGDYGIFAWDLCAKCVFLTGMLIIYWHDSLIDYIMILALVLLSVTTQKAKGYVAAALVLGGIVWLKLIKKRIKLWILSIVAVICFTVAAPKIYYYYIVGFKRQYARAYMMQKAFEIAKDYFPIGTGWSTYGSHLTVDHYSPVYWLYDMGYHWELGFTHRLFLNDSYVACVLGETGFIGMLAIIGACACLLFMVLKSYMHCARYYIAGLIVWAYLMVTFVEESGFMQPVLMCLAVVLGMVSGKCHCEEHVAMAFLEETNDG